MIKIAILKEEEKLSDKRVPFTPKQLKHIKEKFGSLVCCQSSKLRCFTDEEYMKEGIEVKDDVSNCDVFFGVKEVDKNKLIKGKKYLFFSHTIKKQAYNRNLLKRIIEKKIMFVIS